MIPESYEAWRHCITDICRIPLTAGYCEERIAALQDPRDHGTRRFVELYGEAHRERVLSWFVQTRQPFPAA